MSSDRGLVLALKEWQQLFTLGFSVCDAWAGTGADSCLPVHRRERRVSLDSWCWYYFFNWGSMISSRDAKWKISEKHTYRWSQRATTSCSARSLRIIGISYKWIQWQPVVVAEQKSESESESWLRTKWWLLTWKLRTWSLSPSAAGSAHEFFILFLFFCFCPSNSPTII